MGIDMNTEQEREAFEAWAQDKTELYKMANGEYSSRITRFAWFAYQAGRAALQSQDRDSERLDWLEARAHDSSYAIQLRLLRDPAINAGMNRIEVRTGVGSGMWERPTEGRSLREAIDHARRVEGGGE